MTFTIPTVETFVPQKRTPFVVTDLSPALQALLNDKEAKRTYMVSIPYADDLASRTYTQWQLHCAFNLLIGKDKHWKDDIKSTISKADFDICDDACSHMTGGCLDAIISTDTTYTVISDGYYVNIGS